VPTSAWAADAIVDSSGGRCATRTVNHPPALLDSAVAQAALTVMWQKPGMTEQTPRMGVLSVNVGRPRRVSWRDTPVTTGIFKEPVDGRVHIRTLNLDGDRQADLSVHGGWDKAVYAYPSEFYDLWREERPELELPWSRFGENLTTRGLVDGDVSVGDRFRVGTAELIVTQPRLPCFKLGIRMDRDEFVLEFLERGLLGFYFAVAQEGDVEAGDAIVELSRHPAGFRVTEITRLYAHDRDDVEGLRRAVELEVLPEGWRNHFRNRLSDLQRRGGRRLVPAAAPPAWPGYRPFEVCDKVRESNDVSSFCLRPTDGAPLPTYRPGQYLTIRIGSPGNGAAAVRSYSLSDSPGDDRYRLTVKRIAKGVGDPAGGLVSNLLHTTVGIGDVIEAKAPAGRFTIDPAERHRPLVLIAGGIGITPILAMLNSIVEQGNERETWVFYGVRDRCDHLMRDHLEELAARHDHVHLHVAYSRPMHGNGNGTGPPHHTGRISIDLLKTVLPASYYDYYVCGPGSMMRSLVDGLQAWGVPDDRIHTEAFGPAAIRAEGGPSGKGELGAQITFARSATTTTWSRCDSPLLELAEETGVSIPFGCRSGSCGTCATRVVSGDISYLNEPGAPLADGEILACVAVPASDLVLDV
jgi:ferredoxin-NADP reductase/MOSC domain-containing protein YiiM